MSIQITLDVEKINDLFLKEELGTGRIADDAMSFGICQPGGEPYIHLRGEYYCVSGVFQAMLRAVHEQESCEEHPAPCDEHVAQPASRPARLAEIARAYGAKD